MGYPLIIRLFLGIIFISFLSAFQFVDKNGITSNFYSDSLGRNNKLEIHQLAYKHANVDDMMNYAWLNYGVIRDLMNEKDSAQIYSTYLFPDSTVYAAEKDQFKKVKTHSIANVLDVYAPVVESDFYDPSCSNSYSILQMGIMYKYGRLHSDTSIVDTLVVDLYREIPGTNLKVDFISDKLPVTSKVDTVFYRRQLYDSLNNTSAEPNKVQFKILLTSKDTAISLYRILNFDIDNFNILEGNLVGSSFSFKPGYSYKRGDTITINKNYFMFASYDELGTNELPGYSKGDFNVSSMITSDARNIKLADWKGYYIPAYAFDTSNNFEHHLIYYYVGAFCGGVNEGKIGGELILNGIYPQPASNGLSVELTVNKSVSPSLNIKNILGQVIVMKKMNMLTLGKHVIPFTTNDLPSGIYVLTIETDKGSISKQVIIGD